MCGAFHIPSNRFCSYLIKQAAQTLMIAVTSHAAHRTRKRSREQARVYPEASEQRKRRGHILQARVLFPA